MKKNHEPKKNDVMSLQKKPFPNPLVAPLLTIRTNVEEAKESGRIARNLIDGHPLIARAIQNK